MAVNQARTNQSGAVASFIIGGVVLLVILVGGVYLLQKRGQNPTNSPAVTKSSSPSTSPQTTPAAMSPSPTPKASPSTQPSQPPIVTVPNGTPLPATGPQDDASTLIAFAFLTVSAVSFIRSRRLHNKAL